MNICAYCQPVMYTGPEWFVHVLPCCVLQGSGADIVKGAMVPLPRLAMYRPKSSACLRCVAVCCPMNVSLSCLIVCTCAVQGSGADIVKGAMVYLQEQLASTGLSEHCHMLLQVHLGDGGHVCDWWACVESRSRGCFVMVNVLQHVASTCTCRHVAVFQKPHHTSVAIGVCHIRKLHQSSVVTRVCRTMYFTPAPCAGA